MLTWFERVTRSPLVVVVAFGLNFACLRVLFGLEERFVALTGTKVFDTQNGLTAELLLEQRALYVGAAREAYLRFAVFDFVFPLVAALALVVLWAFVMQRQQHPWLEAMRKRRLYLAPFAVTLFDYGENVTLLRVLDVADPSRAELAIVFKRLKLASLALTGAATWALVLFALGLWAWRRFRR
jgi:hypothetical protein